MATNIIISKATIAATETAGLVPSQAWVAAEAGVAMAALFFKTFFKDWSGFRECIVYAMKPDWISWFQGQGVEDWWGELKLGVWIAISVISGILTYQKLPTWLPSLFGA